MISHVPPGIDCGIDQRRQESDHIDRSRCFRVGVTLEIGQDGTHHAFHLIKVGFDRALQRVIGDDVGTQTQSRDRGPKVMRDGSQSLRSVQD